MAITNTDILIEKKDDCLTISLPECLDDQTVAKIWQRILTERDTLKPKNLNINASKINFCDGAGIALLTELSTLQANDKHHYEITGLRSDIDALLETLINNNQKKPASPEEPTFITNIGLKVSNFQNEIKETLYFIGEFTVSLCQQCFNTQPFRWKTFWKQMQSIGPGALPITALLGFILGLILSFQALVSLNRFGATIYTVNLVGISLTRELGALMTGVILAGRTASSFAAAIGTMKINQEVDALTTMGIKPMHYLVLPRVIAGIIMTPLLTIYLILFGLLGCFLVMYTQGVSFQIFISQLIGAVTLSDAWMGTSKAIVFGIIITCIGCLHGMKTKNHALAVGISTTKAVVSSIVMLAVADGILTIIFYIL